MFGIAAWFPNANLLCETISHEYTSIVWDTIVDDTAVFLNSKHSVEIYPQTNEVYACGCPEKATTLPDDPKAIVADTWKAALVECGACRCSSALANAPVKS